MKAVDDKYSDMTVRVGLMPLPVAGMAITWAMLSVLALSACAYAPESGMQRKDERAARDTLARKCWKAYRENPNVTKSCRKAISYGR